MKLNDRGLTFAQEWIYQTLRREGSLDLAIAYLIRALERNEQQKGGVASQK